MKKGVLIISSILSVVLVTSRVSAFSGEELRGAANQIIEWIQNIFGPFFEILLGATSIDEYFFVRVMLLLLFYVMVLTILKRIELFRRYSGVYILISAIVSILAARYITEIELVEAILIPYGALGISLAVFLPFLIYFFFVHHSISSSAGRRLGWILFAAIFFGLWITRYKETDKYNYIYWIGVVAVIICLIFDRKIHEYFGLFEEHRRRREEFNRQIARIDVEIANLIRSGADTPEVRNQVESLRRRRKELLRERGWF